MNQSWVAGMFSDGLVYASISKNLTINNIFPKLFYAKNYYPEFWEHPPFIIGLQAIIFKIVGISWSSAKFLNLFWNLANVTLIYNFIKKERNEFTALYCAMILVLTYPFLRISRFPNMDIALSFFFLLSFIQYYKLIKYKNCKGWYYLGISFGLGLLCKGHPAFLIPFSVGVHLLLTKKINLISSKGPWLSLLIGLLVFSIWPILLFIDGSFYGFIIWFKKQFLATVIHSRGRVEYDFFIYFKNLLKSAFPWFISFLILSYQIFKVIRFKYYLKVQNDHQKDTILEEILICFFWAILISLSIVKFKYGHYIAPAYPFMAIGAGLYLAEKKYSQLILKILTNIVLFAGLILLAFPLTNNIRRDLIIHKSIEILKHSSYKVENFGFVGNSASRWSFVGTVVFSSNYNPVESQAKKCLLLKKSAYLINRRDLNCFKNNPNLIEIHHFTTKNLILAVNM